MKKTVLVNGGGRYLRPDGTTTTRRYEAEEFNSREEAPKLGGFYPIQSEHQERRPVPVTDSEDLD